MRLVAGTACALLLAGAALDRVLERRLGDEFDQRLLARARAIASLTEQHPDGNFVLEFSPEIMPEFSRRKNPDYFSVWVSGSPLDRSPSLTGPELDHDPRRSSLPAFRDLTLPDGRPGRAVELDFSPQIERHESVFESPHPPDGVDVPLGDRRATIVAATSRLPLDRALTELRRGGALVLAALLTLLFVWSWWAVSSGLAPLVAVSRQVEAIDPRRVTERLSVEGAPAEVAPLVDRLNALLARMASAIERERRLSRDLAHELRTPVAELRSLAEVGRRFPDDPEVRRSFSADALAIALSMERTIATLLALARTEAGIEPLADDAIPLAEIVATAVRRVAEIQRRRGIRLSVSGDTEAAVSTDSSRLELLLANLLDNAVHHTPAGALVEVRWRAEGARTLVEVGNPAPGLTAADLPNLFDRFWRKEEARTPGHHAGLGLSLAAEIARSLHTEVTPRLDAAGNLTMSFTLPTA